jgi:hypothetical protein
LRSGRSIDSVGIQTLNYWLSVIFGCIFFLD